MIRRNLLLMGVLLGALCGALAVETLVEIYDGSASLPAKVVMGDWGFLPRPPTPDPAANPHQPLRLGRNWYALKITTLGRYQGARFDFQVPVDTTAFAGVKNTYLQLRLRALDEKQVGGEGAGSESYASAAITNPVAPGGELPRPPGVGPDGAPPVGPVGPVGELPEVHQEPKVKPNLIPMPAFKNLRFTFITEKGPAILDIKPEHLTPVDDGRWERVEIPLSLINTALPMGTKLSRLLITADEPVEMYIGRIAVVKDVTPITVNTFIYPNFLEAGQRIYFAARVEAGLSRYEVQWDFDAKAGASVDAVGERVTHVYDTEGTYTVTCTVRDMNGNKEPAVATLEFKVSRPRAL
ncbi:MAG TPA: PKD domain-containing protein [Armatimonadota bacterium]|nr:PKD domain-containing protein [Armatimonadota bacterium]